MFFLPIGGVREYDRAALESRDGLREAEFALREHRFRLSEQQFRLSEGPARLRESKIRIREHRFRLHESRIPTRASRRTIRASGISPSPSGTPPSHSGTARGACDGENLSNAGALDRSRTSPRSSLDSPSQGRDPHEGDSHPARPRLAAFHVFKKTWHRVAHPLCLLPGRPFPRC